MRKFLFIIAIVFASQASAGELGVWVWEPANEMYYTYKLVKSGSKYRLLLDTEYMGKRSKLTIPLQRKMVDGQPIYFWVNSDSRDHFVVRSDGDLDIRDREGHVGVAKRRGGKK